MFKTGIISMTANLFLKLQIVTSTPLLAEDLEQMHDLVIYLAG